MSLKLADNCTLLTLREAHAKGYVSVSGSGKGTGNITNSFSGCGEITLTGPNQALIGIRAAEFLGGSVTVDKPAGAVRCAICPLTEATSASIFIEWWGNQFGGAYVSLNNCFRVAVYNGSSVSFVGLETLTNNIVTSQARKVFDPNGLIESDTRYSITDVAWSNEAAPLVPVPGVDYSGQICEAMGINFIGVPFFWEASDAIAYVQNGDSADVDFGPSSESDGYDGYTPARAGDNITIPTKPASSLASGLINLYKADQGALQNLGAELFPSLTIPTSITDIPTAIVDAIQVFSDSIWNKNLIDYVISIHVVPCAVSAGSLEDIKVGPRTLTGVLCRPISDEYVDVDCGSVDVDAVYKNFGDYLTRLNLFLPFYGFVPISIEDAMGGEIGVKYRFNVIDGSFVVWVTSTSNKAKTTSGIIGQYSGAAVVHLPLTGANYSNMFSSLIGGAATVAAASGAVGVAGAVASSALNVMSNGNGQRVGSNSYSASGAFMSRRRPFIVVERPISSFSQYYLDETGAPSNVEYTLGNCSGFTKCVNPIVEGIPGATDKDMAEIKRLLMEGVYL